MTTTEPEDSDSLNLLDDLYAFEDWTIWEGFDAGFFEEIRALEDENPCTESGSLNFSLLENHNSEDSAKSQSNCGKRKRQQASEGDNASETSSCLSKSERISMKKKLYYKKKVEFNNKIKILTSIPQKICAATNAGDIDTVREIGKLSNACSSPYSDRINCY